MKHNYSKLLFVAFAFLGLKANAQCSSCTTTITGVDIANHIVTSGTTLCISPTGTATGLITVAAGGTLCNQGTINSSNLWVAGGTLNNYGTMTTSNILTSTQGTLNNYGTINMDSLLVTNASSVMTNNGSITGIRLGNSDNSFITNNGTITVDFMGDSLAGFTNNATGSFIVNYDFGNAYNCTYTNYGYFKVMRDWYNAYGATFVTHCMGIVGRDWYNSATILGPVTASGCGGLSIAGASYNSGTIGSGTTHLDLCDAGHPVLGIDGPGGTIAATTTYCTCSNTCVQAVGIYEAPVSNASIINVYPNPAQNDLTIIIQAKQSENLQVEVLDMMGKKILHSSMKVGIGENATTLDISSLAKGAYILNVIDSNRAQAKQLFTVVK